ncbi:hypothetical protein LP114_082 [Listeria phage LP-114]|uniref:Uncharacterized protein n=1 Tax=Listeria phage LP-114 TaxID=1458857 RepID=A0A059T7T8_9CAUD|nr:hypothetical protein LP114_082 [Listeria phage LP-114]AHL18670.1 hypothetical protein LP114_082 [Listeria phage LP-114]
MNKYERYVVGWYDEDGDWHYCWSRTGVLKETVTEANNCRKGKQRHPLYKYKSLEIGIMYFDGALNEELVKPIIAEEKEYAIRRHELRDEFETIAKERGLNNFGTEFNKAFDEWIASKED